MVNESSGTRLAASKRRNPLQERTEDDDDSLVEDEVAHLTETNRQAGVQDVISEIGLVHPVIYDGYDICELVTSRQDALSKFNVAQLKGYLHVFRASLQRRQNRFNE